LRSLCSIALDRIGIGLTYTSKCGIPIITVLLTLLLDGVQALPNIPTLISLIPIAFGIAAASWSAPNYELFGFIMACISATAQSALNVTSKRALSKAKLSGPIGQRTMVAVGLLFTLTINLIQIVMTTIQRRRALTNSASDDVPIDGKLQKHADTPPLWLTFMAMVAYHVEYLLSFIFVTLVGPITYGTCDAIRRLCIILFGRIFFGGDPFTQMNKIGIATALLGALCYSIVNS
jgi:Triose-phosphate Transporter family